MAAQGRCAGCGKTGTARKIDVHTLDCEDFQVLHARSPAAALGAQAEYARWAGADKAQGRLDRRDTGLAVTRAARAVQAQRFARLPDVLADE